MNKLILQTAQQKLTELLKKYDNFNYIFLDNWRGYRFVYDINKDCTCKYGCSACPLYQLLKNEKPTNGFTAGLYLTSLKDRQIFGPSIFLNIRSYKQYQQCFLSYLKSCKTKKQIEKELKLIYSVRLLYSKKPNLSKQGKKFKQEIIKAL